MLWIILGITISYLLGSIPTAYIFCRLLKGVDVRTIGSGNVGATNASRILGKRWGITVLAIDILKGFAATLFLGNIISARVTGISGELLRILLGLACIFGHNWTIFLKFKGGKGMATTLGVLLGLAFKISGLKIILGLVILTWFLIFLLFRIVSLASVLSAVSLPIYAFFLHQTPLSVILSFILCLFIILRHKSNLKRILQGKEPRLSFRKPR